MNWFTPWVIVIVVSSVNAAEYTIITKEKAYVYDSLGTCHDTSMRIIEGGVVVNRSALITIEFNPIQMELVNGKERLAMPPEMLEMFSNVMKSRPGPGIRLEISPDDPNALRLKIPSAVLKGSHFQELERKAGSLIGKDPSLYPCIFPVAWIAKVPFIWSVSENIKPGDMVDVLYRQKMEPGFRTSAEHVTRLICVERNDDQVILQSNQQIDEDEFRITWSVKVVFDISKQLPVNIVEDWTSCSYGLDVDNNQTTRETIIATLNQ